MLPTPERFAIYLGAAIVLILTPGQDTVYVLARGAGRGRRAGVLAALGVSTGVLIHTAAVSLGLAALLRASPRAFAAVKYAGAAYLVYLGLSTLLGRRGGLGIDAEVPVEGGTSRAYLRGVAVNVLNPKVALFFLAFLPGFAPDGAATTMLLLGAAYAALTACYLGAVGALSGTVGGVLGRNRRLSRWLDGAAGAALVGLGGAIVAGI